MLTKHNDQQHNLAILWIHRWLCTTTNEQMSKGNSNCINDSSLLDHALHLLHVATTLEESKVEDHRIEAATKYYEAVYLLKQFLGQLPKTPQNLSTQQYLLEKIIQYERRASDLLKCAATTTARKSSSTTTSLASDRSVAFAVAVPIPSHPPQEVAAAAEVSKPPIHSVSFMSLSLPQLATQANARLAKAMDWDERQEIKAAIEEYMAAAELYLRCIKLVEEQRRTQSEATHFKRLLRGALDRAETLKYPAPIQKQLLRGWEVSPIMSRHYF